MIQMSDIAESNDVDVLRTENERLRKEKAFANGIFDEIGLGLWSFEMDEVRYPYHHPERGVIQVVCGGTEKR